MPGDCSVYQLIDAGSSLIAVSSWMHGTIHAIIMVWHYKFYTAYLSVYTFSLHSHEGALPDHVSLV